MKPVRSALIIEPGTRKTVRRMVDTGKLEPSTVVFFLAIVAALIAGVALIAVGPLLVKVIAGLVDALLVGGIGAAVVSADRRSVGAPAFKYKGMPIVGEARTLLLDAAARAGEAQLFVSEIPTKLDWDQFRPHVEQLLWDAAGHAAEVSKLNEQLGHLRYAEAGTPQGDLNAEMAGRRQQHLAVIAAARDELTHLAAAAGNASASARMALERTGRVSDLEVVSPSAPALIAKGGLDEAQTQLKLLSDAWAEVDAAQDAASRRAAPAPRERQTPPPSGQQQEG